MIEDLRVLDSLLWTLVAIDLKMRMNSVNSVYSARMANSLSGSSRAARDFFGMSCVLERVVPHPKGLYSVDGQQTVTSASAEEIIMFVVHTNFVGAKKER